MAPPESDLPQIPGLPAVEAEAAADGSNEGDYAQREAAYLSTGRTRAQMAAEAEVNNHDRNERFRNHFERLAIFALWASMLSLGVVGLVWLAHMILPPCYRWLSTEDVSHIQSIITAGLLVGLVGNHFKKRLG